MESGNQLRSWFFFFFLLVQSLGSLLDLFLKKLFFQPTSNLKGNTTLKVAILRGQCIGMGPPLKKKREMLAGSRR